MKKYKKIYIEITNVCNLTCDFCPKTSRQPQFMSMELFERILAQIKGRTEHIYFHVMGEPLLHPNVGEFLDVCQKYGYKVNITTNGTLIDKAGDDIISKLALRQVNFSLHSFAANISEYTMDSYLDSIFKFIDRARKERELLVCLRLWNLSQHGKNAENRYILHRIEKEFNLDFTIEDKLTECKGIRLSKYIFLNQAAKFDWPDMNRNEIDNKGFCYGLREQIAFLVDGTVVPCCLDGEGTIKLGNIKEQEIEDIINGDRAKGLYDGFTGRRVVEELCKKCGYRARFGS